MTVKITLNDAKKYAKKYKIDTKKVSIKDIKYGMTVELEHGNLLGNTTNVTKNSLEKTFKIALAHLIEFPDYYKRLKKMEKKAEKYWSNKNKNIFINK